jgi:hypothetical protein
MVTESVPPSGGRMWLRGNGPVMRWDYPAGIESYSRLTTNRTKEMFSWSLSAATAITLRCGPRAQLHATHEFAVTAARRSVKAYCLFSTAHGFASTHRTAELGRRRRTAQAATINLDDECVTRQGGTARPASPFPVSGWQSFSLVCAHVVCRTQRPPIAAQRATSPVPWTCAAVRGGWIWRNAQRTGRKSTDHSPAS